MEKKEKNSGNRGGFLFRFRKWWRDTFGWLYLNDSGTCGKTPISELQSTTQPKYPPPPMPIASGFVILPTLFGGVVYPLFDDPETWHSSSASDNH